MEIKVVKVQAEKMQDGKIIYRGKECKHKKVNNRLLRAVVAVGVAYMAVMAVASVILCVLSFMMRSPSPSRSEVPPPPSVQETKQLVEIMEVSYCQPVYTATPAPVVEELDEALVEMLALVIYQEAGGDACSDETRRMVGEVVMNRVADSRFPDTLEEVLLQKAQYGRLHWTGLVWPERSSNKGEAHAVERAHDIARIVLSDEERLLPDDVIFQAEFPQGRETVAEADGLYFCR